MRENPCILHWLADKGDNNIDSSTLYVRFKHALETGMRRLALSGSRLFRVRDMQSEQAWMNVDLWRKHRCVLFLVRYVKVLTIVRVYPHAFVRESLRVRTCVLIPTRICPHTHIHVSLCYLHVSS